MDNMDKQEHVNCIDQEDFWTGKVGPFQVHTRLWYFTLANGRRFYWPRGELLDRKELTYFRSLLNE